CRSGEGIWARLTPSSRGGDEKQRSGPVRTTPIALIKRKNFAIWNSAFPRPLADVLNLSTTTEQVYLYLKEHGASFFNDIVESTRLLRSQVEEALADLVASGFVVSDSFTGLRALLTPSYRKTQAGSRRRSREPVYDMGRAGRWSLLNRGGSVLSGSSTPQVVNQETADQVARILLKRYGVVCKRVLEREGIVVPWRVLLRTYHRLEARGEIRGGRFVAGIS